MPGRPGSGRVEICVTRPRPSSFFPLYRYHRVVYFCTLFYCQNAQNRLKTHYRERHKIASPKAFWCPCTFPSFKSLKRLNAFLLYLNCMFFHRTTGDSSSFRDSSFTLRWKADMVRRVSYPKTQPGLELRPLYSQSSASTTLPLRLPFSVKIKHRKRRHNGFYAKNRMNDYLKLTFVHIRTTCELSYTI